MPRLSRRLRLWDSHRLIRFDLGVQKVEHTSTTQVKERSKNVPLNSVKTRSTLLDFLVISSTRGTSWQKVPCTHQGIDIDRSTTFPWHHCLHSGRTTPDRRKGSSRKSP